MSLDKSYLSENDVSELLHNPSSEVKLTVTEKILYHYNQALLSSPEMSIAEQIFRYLVRDTEMHVRQLIAEQLKDSKTAPKDLIIILSEDVHDEVSTPLLEHSDVLTDSDLIRIIENTGITNRHVAIAKRRQVSPTVSDALVNTENASVVNYLLSNIGASISYQGFKKISDHFTADESVMVALLTHKSIPVSLVEASLGKLSDQLRKKLEKKYAHTDNRIAEVIDRTRELATIKLLWNNNDSNAVKDLVEHLFSINRLTPSIIILSLCMENILFFEASLAKLANITPGNAHMLLTDKGEKGFNVLYARSHLPRSLQNSIHLLLMVTLELQRNAPKSHSIEAHLNAIMEALLLHNAQNEIDQLNYVLAVIKQSVQLLHRR